MPAHFKELKSLEEFAKLSLTEQMVQVRDIVRYLRRRIELAGTLNPFTVNLDWDAVRAASVEDRHALADESRKYTITIRGKNEHMTRIRFGDHFDRINRILNRMSAPPAYHHKKEQDEDEDELIIPKPQPKPKRTVIQLDDEEVELPLLPVQAPQPPVQAPVPPVQAPILPLPNVHYPYIINLHVNGGTIHLNNK